MTIQLQEIPLSALAQNAGYDAFNAGKPSNPGESPVIRSMVQRMPIGDKLIEIREAYKAGYMLAAIHDFSKMRKAG